MSKVHLSILSHVLNVLQLVLNCLEVYSVLTPFNLRRRTVGSISQFLGSLFWGAVVEAELGQFHLVQHVILKQNSVQESIQRPHLLEVLIVVL